MSVQIRIQDNRKEIKEHGDYAFPVNVCVETIQQYEQGRFLWHWHPEIELTWIMSGEMEYRVNDSVYYLKEGEGLFGNSNTLHSGYQVDKKNCSYLSVTFHPRFLYGYESSILQTKYVDFITGNDGWASLKLEKDVGWQREVIDQMKMIYGKKKKKTVDYELRVHILLLEIWQKFYHYFHALPEQSRQPPNSLQRLRDIIGYLQEHYDQNVSLEDVAGYVRTLTEKPVELILSHGHHDHMLGARWFDHSLMDSADREEFMLRTAQLQRQKVQKQAADQGLSVPEDFFTMEIPVPEPLKYLDRLGNFDCSVFDLGGREVWVVRVPGHTAGSVVLYVPDQQLLLTGDDWNPCTWMWFPCSLPVRQWRDTMQELVTSLEDETGEEIRHILCSHRPAPREGRELKDFLAYMTDERIREAPAVDMGAPINTHQVVLPEKDWTLLFDADK